MPQIRDELGLPRSTIRSIIQRAQKSGAFTFESAPRSGRPRITFTRDNRHLVRVANIDTKESLFALATLSKSGQQLGRNTVRKILKEAGKSKRKPRHKPYLKRQSIKQAEGYGVRPRNAINGTGIRCVGRTKSYSK